MENKYPIIFDPVPAAEDVNVLNKGLSDNAKKIKNLEPMESFAFFVKDKEGQVLAGCHGDLFYGCLYVGSLWVTENLRGKGLGTNLMTAAEEYARKNDCAMATVNTMDWEALELYQRLGYKIDFAREGYKNDSTFYFLSKTL